MKSLTSHRIGLSKERMSMFDEIKPNNLDNDDTMPQYSEAKELDKNDSQSEGNELDLLYKNIGKAFIRPNSNKTPNVYFAVGFIAGVIFMLLVFGIVAISSNGSKKDEIEIKDIERVEQPAAAKTEEPAVKDETAADIVEAEEKYIIQAGDTIDKIVVKKYGQYSDEKINEILKLNNISNPTKIQIGQVIILPAN